MILLISSGRVTCLPEEPSNTSRLYAPVLTWTGQRERCSRHWQHRNHVAAVDIALAIHKYSKTTHNIHACTSAFQTYCFFLFCYHMKQRAEAGVFGFQPPMLMVAACLPHPWSHSTVTGMGTAGVSLLSPSGTHTLSSY